MEELRELSGYYSILKSIAFGNTRPNEIAQACGLPRGTVVKYLSVLQNLHIVTREVPITEKHPDKSRKGIYRLSDYYFNFWFRFIMPYKSFIEEGEWRVVLERKIRPYLDQYTGLVFEQIAAEYLKRINRQGRLPLTLERIGKYWDPKRELDIVAIDEEGKRILVGECKWSKKRVGQNILCDLVKKASMPRYENYEYFYALFSRAGFTESLQKQENPNVLLISLDDMDKCE